MIQKSQYNIFFAIIGSNIVDFSHAKDACLEEEDIKERRIKLTTCKDGQFTCNDGQCIRYSLGAT